MLPPDLSGVLRGLPEPMLLVSREGEILSANPAAAQLFQRPLAALVNGKLSELIADEPDKLAAYLNLCARSTNAFPAGFSINAASQQLGCRADGGIAYRDASVVLWLRLRPREATTDTFHAFNKQLNSIADQARSRIAVRRLEEDLWQSENRYARLVDSIEDYGIFLLDRGGNIESWNAGATRITGYREHEVLGRPYSIFFAPEEVAAGLPTQALDQAVASGRFEDEGWRCRKDRSRFWANMVLTAIRDRVGTTIGFAAITRDMTERRAMEAALRESERRMQAILNNSRSIIFLKDLDGRYIIVNSEFANVVRLPRDEIVGKSDPDVFPPDVAARLRANDLRVIRDQSIVEVEEVLPTADGARTVIVQEFPLRNADGEIYALGGIATDITQRKRLENALRTQVELLHTIPAAAWTLNPDGRCDFVNRFFLDAVGLTLEQCVAPAMDDSRELPPLFAVVHPDHRDRVAETIWNGRHSGEGWTIEAPLYHSTDGSYHWHFNRAEPLRDQQGNVVKFVGSSADISELRRAQLTLQSTQERARVIVDTALDAVVTIDSSGAIIGWNAQAEQTFGWTLAEVSGAPMADLIIPPRFREAHKNGLRHFLATGEGPLLNWRMELAAIHRDGHEFPIELTVTALKLADEWIFNAFVRDIAEQKLASERLQESELHLRQMTETIPEMLWSATADGAVDYCNKRVLDYTGLSADEIKGAGWMKTVHPDDIDGMSRAWNAAVASGSPFQFEFRGLRMSDQMYRWCVSRAVPLLDENGRVAKWYGTVVDWHDWKEAEEALHQTQMELERTSRVMTVGQLAASIAHEINQPLAAIATNGETCLHWLAEKTFDPAKARAAIRRVLRDGKRAGTVTERVRTLLTKQSVTRAQLDINDVVRNVLALTKNEIRGRGVLVTAELEPSLPPVMGDHVQLQQVVLNLIVNSLEAMAAVTSRPRELSVQSDHHDDDHIVVAVGDSGTGFAANMADQIFSPFFTTKEGGMGMGLSLCRTIVEGHGGRLWASPGPLYGAVLRFTLPIAGRHVW